MWRCGEVPCTMNNSPSSGNEEYYTTAPRCEMLCSGTLCWFVYFAASPAHWRSVFQPSIEYRINVEVECYNNCYIQITRVVFLLSPYRHTHCLPDHILLAVSEVQGSHDLLLKHSNCCSPNKTNTASTLAISVLFYFSDWSVRVGPFNAVVVSPHLRHGERFQVLPCVRTDWICKRAPFPSGICTNIFSIFATYFTFWPVSQTWESAKWDLSIGNDAYKYISILTFQIGNQRPPKQKMSPPPHLLHLPPLKSQYQNRRYFIRKYR